MSMQGDDPRAELDALIDETARELTSGAPDPALRVRVAERIANRSRTWWRVPVWRPVLAAVVIAVVAVLLWPGPRRVAPLEERPVASVERAPVPGTTAPGGVTASPPEREPETARVTDGPRVESPRAVEPDVLAEAGFEPLVPEPLIVQPIDATLVAVDAIQVPMPLWIERLSIEPISIQ